MISILHISDLHRDSGSGATNETLIESLRRDCDRYSGAGVRRPDIAIVSGDIIYGVSEDGDNADALLAAQYEEAHDLLARLADELFGGDRRRVILAPGNHDVSHPHVLRSTQVEAIPTDVAKRKMLAEMLFTESSEYRWDWKSFELRRITDQGLYQQRFVPYAAFYERFYGGVAKFSLNAAEQYSVHRLPEFGLVVASFSSCFANDLFSRAGRINPSCISRATRDIADDVRDGTVALAVWHHNAAGGPLTSDYLDPDLLQSLIDGGFAIGLHGHQHRPQYLEHRFTADGSRGMAVISAGTLCGGPKTLPSGKSRSYNVVLVDPSEARASVHVREMTNERFDLPVWGEARLPDFNGKGSIDFNLKLTSREPSEMDIGDRAICLIDEKRFSEAYALVSPHLEESAMRRIAVEALSQTDDWKTIKHVFSAPRSDAEFALLAEALYQLGAKPELATLIASPMARGNSLTIKAVVETYSARLGVSR